MLRIWIGGLTVFAIALGWGCGVMEEEAPNREEDTRVQEPTSGEASPALEREQRRTSERLALRTDTLGGGETYLTDGSGRALYLLEGAENEGAACVEACEEQWQPFAVSSGPPAAEGTEVEEELIGSVERDGEVAQITYGGHPLYFYHADRDPGDRKGHEVDDPWGEWYLVQPDGEPLESHGEESD